MGGSSDSATVSFESQRYLLYNDGTNIVPAVLTVTIFEGDTPNDNFTLQK